MSNELNIGNITKDCTVENILHKGNVNVTDDRDRSRVKIGDRVEGVSATNVHFLSNFTYSSLSSSNEQPSTSSQYIDSTLPRGDGAQNTAFAPINVNIGSTNENVTAKSIKNTVNVAKSINTINAFNVLPKTELRPICFRYQPPVNDFIGREEDLKFLRAKLCIGNAQIIVVSGLGGIGKTQLVKKYIEMNREFYRNIVWINSQRKESVEEEFKVLAESEFEISLNVDGKERDFRSLIGMIFDKLSTAKTVLVFDNVDRVDTLEIVRDIVAAVVKPHILITSRIQEFSDSVICRKLEVFSSQEALDYLSTNLSDQSDNESLADKKALADILMNLPLGLRQATGHIRYQGKRDKNYKICSYIAEFNKYREHALNSDLFQNDMLNQYRDTIFTTWKVTMDAIKASKPHGELALRILQIMAYFDNVHIVREIFFNLEGLPSEPTLKERDVISSVALICNYSMVDDSDHQSVLSIHKLVQEVIQIQLESEQRSESTLTDGLRLISQMEKHEKFKVCLAHGISVYLSALRFRELVIEFDTYPSMILLNLHKWGNYIRAFSLANEIKEQFTTMLGVNHPSATLFKVRVAESYNNLGKYFEALQTYEEVLENEKINRGADHPDTILTKHNIAHTYHNLGNYAQAFQRYEEVLAQEKKVLGEDHPDTIATKHNIADLYCNLGRHTEALQMFEEVLGKQKIIPGEDHPNTITTKYNIARSYSSLGKCSEALQMFEEVLAQEKMVLGEDHPNTITTKHNIAQSYGSLGRHFEALQMFEEVLTKTKKFLGEDHPDTIDTKHSIAQLYCNLGKYSEALEMYEGVLEKQKIILGEDHPHTIVTKLNIAQSYENLGKYFEALEMYEEVLEKEKIILGEDHPTTIVTKSKIVDVRKKLKAENQICTIS